MKISIKSRCVNKILFEGEFESTKHALIEAVKRGTNLRHADLSGTNLYGATLYGTNLRHADLSGTNLRHADLSGANLRHADLSGTNLRHADLRGTDLYGTNLRHADLRDVDFRGANFRDEQLLIAPLQLVGLRWFVLITPKYMQVGCEIHTHEEWAGFDRKRISQMDCRAWDWWKEHKDILLSACEFHRKQAEVKCDRQAIDPQH